MIIKHLISVNKFIEQSLWGKITRKLNEICDCKRQTVLIELAYNEPKLEGVRPYYKDRRGNVVKNPGRYANRRWSNLTYVASTYGIHVGWKWLVANFPIDESIKLCDKVFAIRKAGRSVEGLSKRQINRLYKLIVLM